METPVWYEREAGYQLPSHDQDIAVQRWPLYTKMGYRPVNTSMAWDKEP